MMDVQGLRERANQYEEMNAKMMELTTRLNSAESQCSDNEARLHEKEAAVAAAESAQKQAESDRVQVLDICIIVVLGRIVSPSSKLLITLTTLFLQVWLILHNVYISWSHLPALLSTCSSATEDTRTPCRGLHLTVHRTNRSTDC